VWRKQLELRRERRKRRERRRNYSGNNKCRSGHLYVHGYSHKRHFGAQRTDLVHCAAIRRRYLFEARALCSAAFSFNGTVLQGMQIFFTMFLDAR
jgi:hypothetical protein